MSRAARLWLAAPTRLAGLKRGRARLALALLALLLLASLTALGTAGPPVTSGDPANRNEDRADLVLYETVVAGVRDGGDYYRVVADAHRAGGYPMRPFVTFRLPTLAVVEAALPDAATLLLLWTLAVLVLVAWWARWRPTFTRPPPRLIAVALMAGGMAMLVGPELALFHEAWAGLLLALSLALRAPGRWLESVAIGLSAALIRETAALYLVIMGVLALLDGQRREAIGWTVALLLLGAVIGLHAHSVAEVVRDSDPASPGWAGLLGFGFFVNAAIASSALALAPAWLAAPLVGLALFGWASWDDPVALRAITILSAYAALIGVAGRADTFYWAMLVAPLLLPGLAFAPDSVRDLWRRALDRRRITVQTISR